MDCNDNQFGQWTRASEDVLKTRYPIHKCCRDGDIENLSLLIVTGQQNLLVEDEFYGWTPAHWAAYFGQLACLRRIMQVLSTEPSSSRYQQTPAHLAAFAGHPHCLQWLFRTGSDLHTRDYLGETPVHKAARTGSMECVSLIAAENADLNAQSSCGLNPATLAAKCGYVDCALYLQRAAEQQQLKQTGVIDTVMLPILQTQSVLPGQKPDRCIITQGLNGGRLPNSIDSLHHHAGLQQPATLRNKVGVEEEMEESDLSLQSNGLNTHDRSHINGFQASNGLHVNNGYHISREFLASNGFQNGNGLLTNGSGLLTNGHSAPTLPSLQKDVLLSERVAKNEVAVAGRKRCREEVGDGDSGGMDELKRMRHLETGGGDTAGQCVAGGGFGVVSPALTASSDYSMDNGGPTAFSTQGVAAHSVYSAATQLYHSHVPVVNEGMCSHNFYCSHKYKNAPCI